MGGLDGGVHEYSVGCRWDAYPQRKVRQLRCGHDRTGCGERSRNRRTGPHRDMKTLPCRLGGWEWKPCSLARTIFCRAVWGVLVEREDMYKPCRRMIKQRVYNSHPEYITSLERV